MSEAFEQAVVAMARKRKVKGLKQEATTLHSLIVRARAGGRCENCGATGPECAHIVGRSWSGTRTDPDNALALCRDCHYLFDNFHEQRDQILRRTGAIERCEALREKAEAYKASKEGAALFWARQVLALRELAKQMELAA